MDNNTKAQFNRLIDLLYTAQAMLFLFEDINKGEITPDAQARLNCVERHFERLLEEMHQTHVRL